MTKIIKHRKMSHLKPETRTFAQLSHWPRLSELLEACGEKNIDRILFAGKLEEMTRDWMMQPLSEGWQFANEFAFKHRVATYARPLGIDRGAYTVSVKLGSHRESWFPGCEDQVVMSESWKALESEWKSTGLPLLSSPAATGRALLWETLPCKDGAPVEFPSLDDDLAKLIRANSPQHRIEQVICAAEGRESVEALLPRCIQYDGRWMYAAMCGLDRLPIGEPKRVGGFVKYQPGIYNVTVQVPKNWNHVGLIPVKGGNLNSGIHWEYPSAPGLRFKTWAFEPELTLALKYGWEIMDVQDGYAFEKGRPLLGWSDRLVKMRRKFQESAAVLHPYLASTINGFAAAAVRQILNHTIGAMHRNDFEREEFISGDNFRKWRRENPDLAGSEFREPTRVEGGYMVPVFVQDTSRFAIYMPHWTSTLYSLARARVAEWALLCDPSTLVKINGDAIYSTAAQPEIEKLDTQRLGQPRRK